jgi:hypothetical protein
VSGNAYIALKDQSQEDLLLKENTVSLSNKFSIFKMEMNLCGNFFTIYNPGMTLMPLPYFRESDREQIQNLFYDTSEREICFFN